MGLVQGSLGFLISSYEVINRHVNYVAVDSTDEIIVLFSGEWVGSIHLLLEISALLFWVLLAFKNRLYYFGFVRFLLPRISKSSHCCRHYCCGCVRDCLVSSRCFLTPRDPPLIWFGLVFWSVHYSFRIKVGIPQYHLVLIFAVIPIVG